MSKQYFTIERPTFFSIKIAKIFKNCNHFLNISFSGVRLHEQLNNGREYLLGKMNGSFHTFSKRCISIIFKMLNS